MKRLLRLIPLFALAAVALAIAACGSGHSATVPSLGAGTGTQASASPGSLAAVRAAVDCARKHGMQNVPDPVVGANGQVTFPGGEPTPTPAVRTACAAQIRAATPTGSTRTTPTASVMQALDRYAACLRTHGLPRWPDPNSQGVFHVKSADAGMHVSLLQRADAACRSLVPPGDLSFDVTPSGR